MRPRVRWDLAMQVARWEFRRFVKPRQLLFSLVLTLVSAGVSFGVVRLFDRSDDEPVRLAVVGAPALGLTGDALGDRFVLRAATEAELPALGDSVAAEALDGVLVSRDGDRATLLVRKRASWRPELEAALGELRRQRRLSEAGIAPERLAALLAPVALEVTYHESGSPPTGAGERLLAIAMLALAFTGLMTGVGYAFAGISGEKQQRITEQLVSAIPPQSWMDGKILGLAAVSIVNTLTTGLALVALFLVGQTFVARLATIDLSFGSPLIALLMVLLPLLGFLLWFAFLCAVSAVIDDPNSSTKGPLLMLPLLPMVIAFLVFTRPDGTVSQFFAIFPLTSWVVLPTRLLLTSVPWWETVLGIALLVATIWLFRRAAGKIFATGMLMYGKEPSVREMWRWAREA
jgi:ABC-2 type transport system permease protein